MCQPLCWRRQTARERLDNIHHLPATLNRWQRDCETQSAKNIREQTVGYKGVGHPVRHDHHDRRISGLRKQLADGPVDGLIDASQRIAMRRDKTGIVRRVSRVVQMPALVADAVRLREDLQEQVPGPALDQFAGESCLGLDASNQGLDEPSKVLARPARAIAVRRDWMTTLCVQDFTRELGRGSSEAENGIMTGPLDGLDAPDGWIELAQGRVEDGDSLVRAAQRLPEHRGTNVLGFVWLGVPVGARHKLHQVMNAVTGWTGA